MNRSEIAAVKRLIVSKRTKRIEHYSELIDYYKTRNNRVEVNRCLKEKSVLEGLNSTLMSSLSELIH
jgi:hypothetical protein